MVQQHLETFLDELVAFRKSVAALPPEIPNGPATCRRCRAPIAVRPNHVVSRCPYCQTDNFVSGDVGEFGDLDDVLEYQRGVEDLYRQTRVITSGRFMVKVHVSYLLIGGVVGFAVLLIRL